jgi:hypothetical protein
MAEKRNISRKLTFREQLEKKAKDKEMEDQAELERQAEMQMLKVIMRDKELAR